MADNVNNPQSAPADGGSGHQSSQSPPSSGPSTHATAHAPVPSKIRRRNRMITSCLECRRRKLKCDKSHPCTNCTKFARDCVFLAPALDTASQHKITEIKEKMGFLDRVLEQEVARKRAKENSDKSGLLPGQEESDEDQDLPIPDDEKDLEPTPLAVIDAAYEDDADDDILDLGIKLGKMRMTDRLGGFVRPKMTEELTFTLGDLRNDHRSPEERAQSASSQVPDLNSEAYSFLGPGPNYLAPQSGFFFGKGVHQNTIIEFLPSKLVADRLMQQYFRAVHPICRVVHRPSFEQQYEVFWAEIFGGIEPAGSLQAVVFAAILSAAVSLAEDDVLNEFGVAKRKLVENFQLGTETALGRANFLRTTKVETLQALVMYMIPMCRNEMSRAHSALVGTAIRLAECMGLHRDPTEYGLPPIETHVRRMVWYQLCFLDVRTCEAQGPRPCIRKDDFDSRYPLNINDNDLLQPNAVESTQFTDMTFARIRFECNEMHRMLWVDRLRLEKKQVSLTHVLGKIENFRKAMDDRYLPMFDETNPFHRCAHLVLNVLVSRMHIMVLHRYHNSVSVRIPDRLRQIILTTGTKQMEDAIQLETAPDLQPWAWYTGAYQQYHTAFLLLVEVFSYPLRREADRIWNCLDYIFETNPVHSRPQKARVILTELRDKSGVFRNIRKVRAPISMMQRLYQKPPRRAGESTDSSLPMNFQDLSSGSRQEGEFSDPTPVLYMYSQTTPKKMEGSEAGSSDSGNYILGPGGSTGAAIFGATPATGPRDDLMMIDIDWNEWDKLFPPEINTGSLDVPFIQQ